MSNKQQGGQKDGGAHRRRSLAQVLFSGGDINTRNDEEVEHHQQQQQQVATTVVAAAVADRVTPPLSTLDLYQIDKKTKAKDFEKRRKSSGFFSQQRKFEEESAMRPKVMHVMVMGPKKVGKTALLRNLAGHSQTSTTSGTQERYMPTLEDDTYHIQLHKGNPNPRQSRELIFFHDTAGIPDFGNLEIKRAHLQVADAFLLVYSVLDSESFNRVNTLKKQLDKEKLALGKDKKEIPIVVVGTKKDIPGHVIDTEFALHWANGERVRLFETSTLDHDSIVDMIHYLSGKFFNKEAKISLSRRLKPEKSNAQIVMDF